jgi:hypothetical protein
MGPAPSTRSPPSARSAPRPASESGKKQVGGTPKNDEVLAGRVVAGAPSAAAALAAQGRRCSWDADQRLPQPCAELAIRVLMIAKSKSNQCAVQGQYVYRAKQHPVTIGHPP